MHDDRHLPYSRKGLEDLAVALGVNSAFLWVSPDAGALEVRHMGQVQKQHVEQNAELEEEK